MTKDPHHQCIRHTIAEFQDTRKMGISEILSGMGGRWKLQITCKIEMVPDFLTLEPEDNGLIPSESQGKSFAT